jgi:hypothetical protein
LFVNCYSTKGEFLLFILLLLINEYNIMCDAKEVLQTHY